MKILLFCICVLCTLVPQSYLVAKAPANNLIQTALERIEKEYLTPGKALHSWYITEDLILLADDDIEEDVKLELLKAR